MRLLKILLLSTTVGPLGSGLGGGVEATVVDLAQVLTRRGHKVTIAAPLGSTAPDSIFSDGVEIAQIPGIWQPTAQTQSRTSISAAESALANLWSYARQVQAEHDVLVNFAYDWLPFYLTPFLSVPVAHFVSMGSLSDRIDTAVAQISAQFPSTLGAYSRAQAETFCSGNVAIADWEILGGGVDLEKYQYCDRPQNYLAWVGRISPEKGLEDAVSAALLAQKPLKIFGRIEDAAYWKNIQSLINPDPQSRIEYCGFLLTESLQQQLGPAQALLVTPKWIEAFGLVAIEAMACGVPVVAYQRGGLTEIVCSGRTGWLVEPDDVKALAIATDRLDRISRRQCRQRAEELYSLSAWGQRFEQWLYKVALASST